MLTLEIVKVIGDGFEGSYGPGASTATRGKRKRQPAAIPSNIEAHVKMAGIFA
jgi:hypothetical protein